MRRHPRGQNPITVEKGPLRKAKVFDTKVVAINKAVVALARKGNAQAVVFSDNIAAVEACKYRAAPSSQAEALEVQNKSRQDQLFQVRGLPTKASLLIS